MQRNLNKLADKGKNILENTHSEMKYSELIQLLDEADSNGREGIYNALIKAFHFGVSLGYTRGTAERKRGQKDNGK